MSSTCAQISESRAFDKMVYAQDRNLEDEGDGVLDQIRFARDAASDIDDETARDDDLGIGRVDNDSRVD